MKAEEYLTEQGLWDYADKIILNRQKLVKMLDEYHALQSSPKDVGVSEEEREILSRAIGLLSNMIYSGEQHSETSIAYKEKVINILSKLSTPSIESEQQVMRDLNKDERSALDATFIESKGQTMMKLAEENKRLHIENEQLKASKEEESKWLSVEQVKILLRHQIEDVRQHVDRCARDKGTARADFDEWIASSTLLNFSTPPQSKAKGELPSYAIVRWHENKHEDVVCVDKATAIEYVRKYNELAGWAKCFVDEDIWLPFEGTK